MRARRSLCGNRQTQPSTRSALPNQRNNRQAFLTRPAYLPLIQGEAPMHEVTQPAILYFGTPVVLISTVNEDGSFNLAPMSSAWWLGQHCVLGLAAVSK